MRTRTLVFGALLSVGIASSGLAQITGKVVLEGEPPEMREIDMRAVAECARLHPDPAFDDIVLVGEEGELENVIIALKGEPGELDAPVPDDPAVLDQVGCIYTPRIIAMMTGQELVVKNSDPFLHNVHSLSRQNPPFNFGQPNIDPGRSVPSPRVPERFRVKCDVHPWMTAYIWAMDHPFFAVSDEAGEFSIDLQDLPDGEYTIVAWHEQYGEQEQTIEVTDGQAEVNFTFQAAAARAEPEAVREVVLASAMAADEQNGATCGPKSCCGPKDDDEEKKSE